MKEDAVTHERYVTPSRGYRLFKYTVYALLALNVYVFWLEDHQAARELFPGGVAWSQLVDAYPATVDTLWWVILLLLFELETAVIPDHLLRGGLKWLLTGIRSVSYFIIFLALLSYINMYELVSNLEPFVIANVCDLAGTGYTYIADLSEYPPIDATACVALQGQELVRLTGTEIIGTLEAARASIHLTLVDVANASAWLFIVALLEVEVLLQQLRDRLTDRLIGIFKILKIVLYGTLAVAVVYWFIYGDFIDWWDALLWLVAFIFIELNIFQWHAEVEEEKAHHHGDGAPGSEDPHAA